MSETPKNDSRREASGASDHDIQTVHGNLLSKQEEPKQGYAMMPLFMLGFVSTMIFLVAIYFIHNRAGLSEGLNLATQIQDKRFNPDKHMPDDVVVEVDPIAMGQRLYAQVCVACHQVNGMGLPGAFPPLVAVDYVTGDEDRLINILVHGLQGPIEVNGNQYNGIMPAFGPGSTYNWNDEQISYVLTYIRQEWGNEASAISVEQVTAAREATADRTTMLTAADL
jgi:mono/diheme cytochrome c family protein